MRIAVVGAGGTGGYFGGMLARARADVVFIARGPHLEAMRRQGLTVKSRLAGEFTIPVMTQADPRDVGPVDLILFCVKTYDIEAAAAQLPRLMGACTMILLVQNGIDAGERIAGVVGPGAVLGGVAYVFFAAERPGVLVQMAGAGKILFGELTGGTSPRTDQLLETFTSVGIAAELRRDIGVALWEKFINICAVSGVTALTRLPIGTILACSESRAFFRTVMEEVEAVGRAGGVALPAGYIEQLAAFFATLEPLARGSLYHHLMAGRRIELESLNGTVVRLGRQTVVPTPCNLAIYAALKPYIDGPPCLP